MPPPLTWSDPGHVERALRVMETLLRRVRRDALPGHEPSFEEARDLLARDGYDLDEGLRIRVRHVGRLRVHVAALADPSGIHAELERVRRSVALHPDDAIGAAKQLIEATSKVVLVERGQPMSDHDDLSDLVKRSQQALGLNPRQSSTSAGHVAVDPDAANAVKRVLGGLSSVALGVTELRNRYGSGHGRLRAPSGLSARHARLAVNAAGTWCEVMLETLADPSAPWRDGPT